MCQRLFLGSWCEGNGRFYSKDAPGSFPRAFLCLIDGSVSREQPMHSAGLPGWVRGALHLGGSQWGWGNAAGLRGGTFYRGLADDSDSLEQSCLNHAQQRKALRGWSWLQAPLVSSLEAKYNFLPVLMISGNYLPPSGETRGDVMGEGKRRLGDETPGSEVGRWE